MRITIDEAGIRELVAEALSARLGQPLTLEQVVLVRSNTPGDDVEVCVDLPLPKAGA